jgi:primosomal protein N''
MQFRHRKRDTSVFKALSTAANPSQDSDTLAKKLATQIEWMQKKGIDISLKESERPPRPTQKPPLPGTVIYFPKIL